MKKHLALILAFGLAAITTVSAQTALRVAVVDMQKVFQEYYKTKDADVRLKEILGNFQKEYQDMLADYQKGVDEATKLRDDVNNASLSKELREEKGKALQTKVQDVKAMERKLQEFDITRRRQLEDQSGRMRKNIVEEITKVITDMGNREKFNLIMDKSGVSLNGTPSLLFADGVKDITEDVVKLMNANKPAGSPTPAASTAPAGGATKKP
jgi:outer membrane protein